MIDSNRLPHITVAIPTCNRADVLARSLEAVAKQERQNHFTFDILVVDNGSTDHTDELVSTASRGNATSLRRIVEPTRGIPFVRNRAIKNMSGDWLAFFDDDQLTSVDWLLTLFGTAERQDVEIVGGSRSLRIEVAQPPTLSRESRVLLGEVLHKNAGPYHARLLPSTGNVLIRKSVFNRVGNFDESVLDGGEDSDFFNRAVAMGIRGWYAPEARVEHLIPPGRLETGYLRWIAFRHGIHLARRDTRHRGKLSASFNGLLRLGRAGGYHLPNRWISAIRGDHATVVGLDCCLSKTSGFLHYTGSQLLPWTSLSEKLKVRSMHRGTR